MQTDIEAKSQLERFIRRPEVERVTGLSRSSIYEKVAAGLFPQPVKLSAGAVAWVESEIAEWQAQRIAARKSQAEVTVAGPKSDGRDG